MTMPAIAPDAPISSILECGSLASEDQPADDAGTADRRRDKRSAAERPLDVVAEHPQEDHVAEEMPDVGMEELVGDRASRTAGTHPRAAMSPLNAAGVRLKVSIMRSSAEPRSAPAS